MADKVTWTGHKRLERGGDKWSFSDTARLTLVFTGPYSACLNGRPARGDTITEGVFDLQVVDSEVTEGEGETGELHITAEFTPAQAELPTEAIGEAVFEVDFNQVDLPIETHPKCGYLSSTNDGTPITWDDWALLDQHHNAYKARLITGAWTREQYLTLKRAGVDTYPVARPVVRRSTTHFRTPDDVGVGVFTRQNPPIEASEMMAELLTVTPGDGPRYKWVRAHDRCTRRGKTFDRATEWWGFDALSDLIYPPYPA